MNMHIKSNMSKKKNFNIKYGVEVCCVYMCIKSMPSYVSIT